MKYCIERQGIEISIRIDDVAGRSRPFSRRSVDVAGKAPGLALGGMSERRIDGGTRRGRKRFCNPAPRLGTRLEPSGIEECLRYAPHQAVKV
jgi:hypothetical protein